MRGKIIIKIMIMIGKAQRESVEFNSYQNFFFFLFATRKKLQSINVFLHQLENYRAINKLYMII